MKKALRTSWETTEHSGFKLRGIGSGLRFLRLFEPLEKLNLGHNQSETSLQHAKAKRSFCQGRKGLFTFLCVIVSLCLSLSPFCLETFVRGASDSIYINSYL